MAEWYRTAVPLGFSILYGSTTWRLVLVGPLAAVVVGPDGLWPWVQAPCGGQTTWGCSNGKRGAVFGRKDPQYRDRGSWEGLAHYFFLLKSESRKENEYLYGDRHGYEVRECLCIS